MASAEYVKNSQQVYAKDFTLAAGTIAAAAADGFTGVSKPLYIVRKTAAGTPGIPKLFVTQPSAAGAGTAVYKIGLHSSDASDTSTYTLYWYNQNPQTSNALSAVAGTTAGLYFLP